MYPPFTPASGAVVTAASSAASLAIPAPFLGKSFQLFIQVAAGANAAISLTGTAEAPDGTPDSNAVPFLGGNAIPISVGPQTTTISYIRVGGSDATIYFIFGFGE